MKPRPFGPLPRALWYDSDGRAHYSIPWNHGKPAPAPYWLEWLTVAALALSLFGGVAMILIQGL